MRNVSIKITRLTQLVHKSKDKHAYLVDYLYHVRYVNSMNSNLLSSADISTIRMSVTYVQGEY